MDTRTTNSFDVDELKTGMIVTLRNGSTAMVMLNTEEGNVISGDNCYFNINLLDVEFKITNGNSAWDVIKVDSGVFSKKESIVLWEEKVKQPVVVIPTNNVFSFPINKISFA